MPELTSGACLSRGRVDGTYEPYCVMMLQLESSQVFASDVGGYYPQVYVCVVNFVDGAMPG